MEKLFLIINIVLILAIIALFIIVFYRQSSSLGNIRNVQTGTFTISDDIKNDGGMVRYQVKFDQPYKDEVPKVFVNRYTKGNERSDLGGNWDWVLPTVYDVRPDGFTIEFLNTYPASHGTVYSDSGQGFVYFAFLSDDNQTTLSLSKAS